ncbi:MAG: hypothetical protein IJD89_03295, partial [Clostridia bacterium]|nr:hypothetical protein [Clostridia bacterium]
SRLSPYSYSLYIFKLHESGVFFFYPSRRLGIASRLVVYLITIGVYHQLKAVLLPKREKSRPCGRLLWWIDKIMAGANSLIL